MAIVGLRSVADFTADGQRPKNWREGILMLYPNGGATLTALTALMKERVVDDPEYNWFERLLSTRRFAVATAQSYLNASDVQTSITLDVTGTMDASVNETDARQLKTGDLLYVEANGEILRVAADPTSASVILVDRGFAGSTKAATTSSSNPNLLVIGSSYEEGSLPPSGVQIDPTKKNNYTQIFRQTLEFTRTAMRTRLRTGDQVNQAKKDALEFLSMDMERAFIFGKKNEGTKNGKPIRTTDGVVARLTADASANIVTGATSGTKMTDLETYLEAAFRYGSDEKIAFMGNGALLALQQIIRKNATFNIENGVKEYGMNVARVNTPFGTLVVKRYALFTNNQGGTATSGTAFYGMTNWALIIDAAQLTYTYLKGSDIAYQSDLQASGLDGEKSGYLGECSIEVHNAKTHFLIKRLISGIKDT